MAYKSILKYSAMIMAIFVGLFLYKMRDLPDNWLGLMDGYFYGNMIKVYLDSWSLRALDTINPANYPPYFFWVLGRLGSIFALNDLGTLQLIGFIFGNTLFFGLFFAFICSQTKNVPLALACFSVSILVLIHAAYADQIYQKYHESLSLCAIFVMCRYFAAEQKTNIENLFLGLLTGLGIGTFTHFLVFPLIAFFLAALLFTRPALFSSLLFLFGLAIGTFPFAWSLFLNFQANGTFGNVPFILKEYFTSIEHTFFSVNEMSVLYLPGFMFAAFNVVLGFRTSFLRERYIDRRAVIMFWLSLSIILETSFVLFGWLMFKLELYYFDGMAKWGAALPVYMTMLLIMFGLDRWEIFSSSRALTRVLGPGLQNNTTRKMALVFAMMLALVSINYFQEVLLKKQSQFRFGVDLSTARNENLGDVSTLVNRLKLEHDLNRYVGSGEFSFLNYYVRGKFVNFLMFNHTYTSSQTNLIADTERFRTLVDEGDVSEFIEFLLANNVDALILNPHSNIIPVMLNFGTFQTSVDASVGINDEFLVRLLESDRIENLSDESDVLILKIVR